MDNMFIPYKDFILTMDKAINKSKAYTEVEPLFEVKNEMAKNLMYLEGTTLVRQGYWEEISDYGGWGDTHYRCSVCGEEWYLEDGNPKENNMNFCPRCGARMDG